MIGFFIRVKRLSSTARLPEPQTKGATGADLYADENVLVPPSQWRAVGTGLAVAIPRGYEIQIRPRSGLAFHHGVTVLNSPGTIDSDYQGEVKILLINHGLEDFYVCKGDRIAQMVIAQTIIPRSFDFCEVEELDQTDRDIGGFGSTGKD